MVKSVANGPMAVNIIYFVHGCFCVKGNEVFLSNAYLTNTLAFKGIPAEPRALSRHRHSNTFNHVHPPRRTRLPLRPNHQTRRSRPHPQKAVLLRCRLDRLGRRRPKIPQAPRRHPTSTNRRCRSLQILQSQILR